MFASFNKIYTVLLRGLFLLALVSGGRLLGIDEMVRSSRNAVSQGLVEIPRMVHK
jgi:hypothetical protein